MQYIAAAMKKKAVGTFNVFLSILGEGLIAMVIAHIKAVLQIIEPIALPYAICECPLSEPVALTIVSGRVVPIETMVAPINNSGI